MGPWPPDPHVLAPLYWGLAGYVGNSHRVWAYFFITHLDTCIYTPVLEQRWSQRIGNPGSLTSQPRQQCPVPKEPLCPQNQLELERLRQTANSPAACHSSPASCLHPHQTNKPAGLQRLSAVHMLRQHAQRQLLAPTRLAVLTQTNATLQLGGKSHPNSGQKVKISTISANQKIPQNVGSGQSMFHFNNFQTFHFYFNRFK